MFCQRVGDSFISSFACPRFKDAVCQECSVHPGRARCCWGSCPVPVEMPPSPCPEDYCADCSTGRTRISREPLLVKSDEISRKYFFIAASQSVVHCWVIEMDFFFPQKLFLAALFCPSCCFFQAGWGIPSFLVIPERVPTIKQGCGSLSSVLLTVLALRPNMKRTFHQKGSV